MHFEESFNADSDVVYGTGDWIHVYLYNYWFAWKYGYPELKDINFKGSWYTSRSLNPFDKNAPDTVDKVTEAAHAKYGTNVINNYNLPISARLYSSPKVETGSITKPKTPVVPLQKDPTEARKYDDYFQSLQRSVAYGPDSLAKPLAELKNALSKYEESQDALSNLRSGANRFKLQGIIGDLAIRRSCKFGIDYFVIAKGAQLHYILDGMSVPDIVSKKMYTNEVTKKDKIPICTSEVRYIFRTWNQLKDTGRLHFYKDFQQCLAPWESSTYMNTWEGWADYAIDRVEKHLPKSNHRYAQFQLAAEGFGKLRNPFVARNVIREFHSIPHILVNKVHERII